MDELGKEAGELLERVRKTGPLVHNITNYVVMGYTANALLSMGAAPVMAHAVEEMEEMVALAGALVINIGTLSTPWVTAMIRAGRRAGELGRPVVLDPVGAGATTFRTETARRIIDEVPVTLVRGNASEVLSLSGAGSGARGVDSIHTVDEAAEAAVTLSREIAVPLAITGAVDLVTDGDRTVRVANGHPLMGRVTGTGCTASAVIGAFLAAADGAPVRRAAASALAFFGLAGEIAAVHAAAPGSFGIALLDALYTLTPAALSADARITEAAA